MQIIAKISLIRIINNWVIICKNCTYNVISYLKINKEKKSRSRQYKKIMQKFLMLVKNNAIRRVQIYTNCCYFYLFLKQNQQNKQKLPILITI